VSETLQAKDFDVRKLWGGNPWVVHHTPTDRVVTIPGDVPFLAGGRIPYQRRAGFRTKREALAWMRDELPSLLLANPTKEVEDA